MFHSSEFNHFKVKRRNHVRCWVLDVHNLAIAQGFGDLKIFTTLDIPA